MDFIILVGYEDVARAGHNMITAASDFGRVADNLTSYMQRLTYALEDHAGALRDHTEALKAGGRARSGA